MIAQGLSANGAKVYIIGRREGHLETSADHHGSPTTGEIIPITGDVTSKDSIEAVVSEIKSREGYINLLVNNAGVSEPKGPAEGDATDVKGTQYGEQDFEGWGELFKTN